MPASDGNSSSSDPAAATAVGRWLGPLASIEAMASQRSSGMPGSGAGSRSAAALIIAMRLPPEKGVVPERSS